MLYLACCLRFGMPTACQTHTGPWVSLSSVSCWKINWLLEEELLYFQNGWRAVNPNFSLAGGHDQLVIFSMLWLHQSLIENNLSQLSHRAGRISQWLYQFDNARSFTDFNTDDQPARDKHTFTCNPEKNWSLHTMVRPVISYYCHTNSVYMNTPLNWNCAYVKNDSLTSPSPQSVTSLVNYLCCCTRCRADTVCSFTPMFSFTLT